MASQTKPTLFDLWPVNEHAMSVILAMKTQLRRAGMSGQAYGLDYRVLPWVMSQVGVPDERVNEVFAQVRIAESELLLMLGEGCNERTQG